MQRPFRHRTRLSLPRHGRVSLHRRRLQGCSRTKQLRSSAGATASFLLLSAASGAKYQAHVDVEQRGAEEKAVDHIETATVSGENCTGILDAGFAFDERFGEVANNRRHTQQ